MPKVVRLQATGDPSQLKIEDEPQRKPAAGEVLLQLQAFGLNRAEVLFRQGNYLEPTRPPCRIGYEGAGTVLAVGEGVDPGWVGKQAGTVPGFSQVQFGLWAEQAIVPASVLAVTPKNLPVEATAAIWMQYLTAYGGLLVAGEMQSGNTVLITAASSSVGLAAIQIAKDQGCVVIATTRTSAKKQELLGLGAEHVVATAEEDLPERVKQITSGNGVDVIFDPVAGAFVEVLAKCSAVNGRIVEYGALSLEPTPFPFRAALNKQLTMRGYTLHQVTADAALRERAIQYVTEKIEAGVFVPKLAKVFHGLQQIGAAQDYMETNSQVGKIVVLL
jgi:NADPH:quinone reductase-like Zn-dependent oxidoreductase